MKATIRTISAAICSQRWLTAPTMPSSASANAAPDDPFRLTSLVWAAVHGMVLLRIDRPNFPWPPLDEMIDDAVRRLLLMPGH
jgi:hypothetical protein